MQSLIPRFTSALPPYLGGKRLLCALIFALLAEVVPRARWAQLQLLDPFCGGGAVALYAKAMGFAVHASDIALRAVIPARALVANSQKKLTRGDVARLFMAPEGAYRRVASRYAPGPLPAGPAAWIDRAIARAGSRPEPVRSLLLLVIIKLTLRLQPMSVLDATDAAAASTGDFDRVSPRRLGHYLHAPEHFTPERVWQVAEQVNAGVIGGRGTAFQGDALDAIACSDAGVLYLDPPYAGTTGYTKTYAVLDELLGDDFPQDLAPSLDALLAAAAHIPTVVLSYGGPTADLEGLTALVGRYREVKRALEIPYAHLRSVAGEEKNRDNREYLVVATR